MTKQKKQQVKEIVWYSILGSVWLLGIILSILGICAFNIGKLIENPLYQAQKDFASFLGIKGYIDFRILGTVISVIAMCSLLICLNFFAKNSDERKAKEAKKKQRLDSLKEELKANE